MRPEPGVHSAGKASTLYLRARSVQKQPIQSQPTSRHPAGTRLPVLQFGSWDMMAPGRCGPQGSGTHPGAGLVAGARQSACHQRVTLMLGWPGRTVSPL